MKKASAVLIIVTVVFVIFIGGFFLGRNLNHTPVQISAYKQTNATAASVTGTVDINTASLTELQTLPGIGPVLAQRIVAYRESYGPFESAWQLANIDGIGEKTIESILDHITVGGSYEDTGS